MVKLSSKVPTGNCLKRMVYTRNLLPNNPCKPTKQGIIPQHYYPHLSNQETTYTSPLEQFKPYRPLFCFAPPIHTTTSLQTCKIVLITHYKFANAFVIFKMLCGHQFWRWVVPKISCLYSHSTFR